MAQPLRLEPKPFIEIHSPTTLNKIGAVTIDSAADVRAAVATARAAFRQWSALDLKARAHVLLSARDLFLARQEDIIQTICAENGKPRLEAIVELTYVCDVITFYAKQAKRFLKSEHITPHLLRNKKVTVHYEPRGVTRRVAFPVKVTINGNQLRATGEETIKQTDFGITPYSGGLGTIKIGDQLTVSFTIVATAN